MAIFLIKANSNYSHSDPVKDARGVYKRGDIVQVLPDTAHDGDLVRNPITGPFVMVKITGLSVEKAKKYVEEDTEVRQHTWTFSQEAWDRMIGWNDFRPFVSQPTIVREFDAEKQTDQGPVMVHYLEVTGNAELPVTRRRWRIRVDDIPLSFRNQLRDNKYVEVTVAQVRDYIRNKRTNQDETTLTTG